jgi:hypothetical protein
MMIKTLASVKLTLAEARLDRRLAVRCARDRGPRAIRSLKQLVLTALLALLVMVSFTSLTPLHALTRIVAQFKGFTDMNMVSQASAPSGGTVIYDTAPLGGFFLPQGHDTLFITVTAASETLYGARALVNCTYDGNPGPNCNPQFSPIDVFPGWTPWQKLPAALSGASNCNDDGGGAGACRDNSVVARWCIPGLDSTVPHNVQIRLAVDPAGSTTYLEAAHFIIDSEFMGNSRYACTQGAVTEGDVIIY